MVVTHSGIVLNADVGNFGEVMSLLLELRELMYGVIKGDKLARLH